jgi:predicted secreted acid phosphatase
MSNLEKSFRRGSKISSYFRKLYQEHFEATFESLNYLKDDPVVKKPGKVFLNQKKSVKKALFLDLDETLIHCFINTSDKG